MSDDSYCQAAWTRVELGPIDMRHTIEYREPHHCGLLAGHDGPHIDREQMPWLAESGRDKGPA